jgi:hypothetical protein
MSTLSLLKEKLKSGPVRPHTLHCRVGKVRRALTEERLIQSYNTGLSTDSFSFPVIQYLSPTFVTILDHDRERTVKHDGEQFSISLGSSGHKERYKLAWFVEGEATVGEQMYVTKLIGKDL